ncbi:hypothetical protein LSTR_LSTR006563 [Laodelphax striatellus]|uniref:Uncharacterized protein n=1 Tax=Laodelphax striatellus TaxID=195883 RepID=A0A482WUG8_LAOST|nr:hypothetical protein LSTR_LSTR006563 [Laodelphax striatellus]
MLMNPGYHLAVSFCFKRSSDEEDEDNAESEKDKKKEIPLEPFNMEEEKEMGTFDKDFNFTWKTKSREPTDAWLANERWRSLLMGSSNDPPNKKKLSDELRELISNVNYNETV